ncbi:MAG: YciI family protein [Devosia sp.]
MRFMMIIKSDAQTEAGVLPKPEEFEAMGKFNEELISAGVLLAADGLHPSKEGAMVSNEGGKIRVVDGPFAESKELVAGFWIISAKDKEEALSWARRIPLGDGGRVEVRRVYEAADFADVLPPEQIQRLESQLAGSTE